MATTTAGRSFAIGFVKQTALVNGATVDTTQSPAIDPAAYTWPRWLQGSSHYPDGQYNHEWEGDGSRGESLSYKKFQTGKATLVCYPRANELAQLLEAFTGTNSLFTGVPALTTPSTRSGQTPAPASSVVVTAPTDDVGNTHYSIASFLRGTTYSLKTADAICHGFTLSAGVGQPFKASTDWSGGVNIQGDPLPLTAVHIDPNGPYFFFDGFWNIANDVGTRLDISPAVKDFNLKFETTLNPEDYQAEQIFPLPLVAGNLTISGEITVLWQNAQAMNLAYFGSIAPTITSDVANPDAGRSGFGQLILQLRSSSIWNAGGTPPGLVNDDDCWATFEFPSMSYEGVTMEPDLSGKPVEQKVMLHATKGTPALITPPTNAATLVPYSVNIDLPPTL